jgi:hypothetical protein
LTHSDALGAKQLARADMAIGADAGVKITFVLFDDPTQQIRDVGFGRATLEDGEIGNLKFIFGLEYKKAFDKELSEEQLQLIDFIHLDSRVIYDKTNLKDLLVPEARIVHFGTPRTLTCLCREYPSIAHSSTFQSLSVHLAGIERQLVAPCQMTANYAITHCRACVICNCPAR